MTSLQDPRPWDPPEYWQSEPDAEPKSWHVYYGDGSDEWAIEGELEHVLELLRAEGVTSFRIEQPA